MKKEKIKVYTYTRVSTAMQVDGYSLDAQKAKMKPMQTITIMRSSVSTRTLASPASLLKAGRNSAR